MLRNFRSSSCQSSRPTRSEEHTSELQSPCNLVCRLLLEKKKKNYAILTIHQFPRYIFGIGNPSVHGVAVSALQPDHHTQPVLHYSQSSLPCVSSLRIPSR